MKAFVSYSTHDKVAAGKLVEHLSAYGIDSFLAHDDLQVSEEWKRRILDELGTATVMILLLSKEFRASDWTSQEIGVFISTPGRLLIPLSLDGTMPYGFVDHIQGKRATPDRGMSEEFVIAPLLRHSPADMTEVLVARLVASRGFRWSEHLMKLLQPFYARLTDSQVTTVLDGAIDNVQIYSAGECRTVYLPDFVRVNLARIPARRIAELQDIFDRDQCFSERTELPIGSP